MDLYTKDIAPRPQKTFDITHNLPIGLSSSILIRTFFSSDLFLSLSLSFEYLFLAILNYFIYWYLFYSEKFLSRFTNKLLHFDSSGR